MDMIEQFEKWFTGEEDCKTRKAMMEKDDAGYYKFQSAYNSFSSWKEAWQQQQAEITRLTAEVEEFRKDKWISVDDMLPEVKEGDAKFFNIVIKRKHDGKSYSMPAVYLNKMELTNVNSYDDEYFTGWYETKEHYEFEQYYSKIESNDGDIVTHWQPLPTPPTIDAAIKSEQKEG